MAIVPTVLRRPGAPPQEPAHKTGTGHQPKNQPHFLRYPPNSSMQRQTVWCRSLTIFNTALKGNVSKSDGCVLDVWVLPLVALGMDVEHDGTNAHCHVNYPPHRPRLPGFSTIVHFKPGLKCCADVVRRGAACSLRHHRSRAVCDCNVPRGFAEMVPLSSGTSRSMLQRGSSNEVC